MGILSSRGGFRQGVVDLSPIFYLTSNFIRFYFDNNVIFYLMTVVLSLYGILLISLLLREVNFRSPFWLLILLIPVGWFFEVTLGSNDIVTYIFLFVPGLGFAMALSHVGWGVRYFEVMFYSCAAVFLIYMVLGVDPENIFHVSRNYISVFMLIAVGMYYFACDKRDGLPSLIVALIFLVLMLYGIGRAGIALGVLFALVTFLAASGRRWYMMIFYVLVAVMFVFWLYGGASGYGDVLYMGIDRFERLGGGGQRDDINSEYLMSALESLSGMLLGPDISLIPSIVEVDGNPHNSYLRLHYGFSVLGFFAIAVIVVLAFWRLLKHKSYFMLTVLVAALFRSAFDSAAFYGPLDILIFGVAYYALRDVRLVFR